MRKNIEEDVETAEEEEIAGDYFENLFKGEISKSGIPILPSKRARKIPQKIEVVETKEDEKVSKEEDHISLETLQDQEKAEEDIKE